MCASRFEHIILLISPTNIFSVLIKTILYMPDATIAWLCSDATYNIEAIYNTVQQKFNPTLHISPPSAIGSAIGLKSKGRWFESRVNHYFSSSNFRLLASRSLQVKTNSQNDWSVTNQLGYNGLRQDSYL